MLTSLATGVGIGAAVFTSPASSAAAHTHHAATPAEPAARATTTTGASSLEFLDQHAFDTLATLSEQIVPGARAVKVPEFLDRLLAVESIDTQKRFKQALGAFEREAREAHGVPWKTLTAAQATALVTTISRLADGEAAVAAITGIKGAVAEIYFESEAGMKELGWQGAVAFVPPAACG